jgi:spermidine synthase
LKSTSERGIQRVVIATGISSIVTQLLTIREFLTQFHGNEIVIAVSIFNWLIIGGIGTFLAGILSRRFIRPSVRGLTWFSFLLAGLSPLQILIIRFFRGTIFLQGTSVGFYPTFAFTFATIAPYCLILGFVLPYSLFVIRKHLPDYPGIRIYITDNIGDIGGGALFAFILVHLLTPFQALLFANVPLLAAIFFLAPFRKRFTMEMVSGLLCASLILTGGLLYEKPSLSPMQGETVFYKESRYGRIVVHKDQSELTLFSDGMPLYSSHNIMLAEETIHYPMSQIANPEHILLVSAQGGMFKELKKYQPKTIDYVELDPDLTAVQFKYGLLHKSPGLRVINQDGRAFLAGTAKQYDAIIVNLPEPDTYQINRFFTDRFFQIVSDRLKPEGVFSFSMSGFSNYLAEPQRQKLSSLYNTATAYFNHTLLLPGQKIIFICRHIEINTDIPKLLTDRGIPTQFVDHFFYGNLTRDRVEQINTLMDPATPGNFELNPHLMRLMFTQWFAKYQTSPKPFILILALLTIGYLFRISREEFVLFTTGCVSMGCEILVIFAFQIFFGYIYLQIGLIVTVFLAGLLPGAWLGEKLNRHRRRILMLGDIGLMIMLGFFIAGIWKAGDLLSASFFLAFGFFIALIAGFQFPAALNLKGTDAPAVVKIFSADLIGAALGTIITSTVLIPFFGIIWTAVALILLKVISFIIVKISYASSQ